jgi:hypothetical protein
LKQNSEEVLNLFGVTKHILAIQLRALGDFVLLWRGREQNKNGIIPLSLNENLCSWPLFILLPDI